MVWRLSEGSSLLSELGQVAGQVQVTGVILAVAVLSKALYPFFSRWLDYRERMHARSTTTASGSPRTILPPSKHQFDGQ